jgi:hypothetical protein
MSDFESEIDRLGDEARDLPESIAKLALYEEAVRLADLSNDWTRAYELRMELMEVAVYLGRSDLLLVAFAWCLAHFDRKPDESDAEELLWCYKWVVSSVIDFPEVSLTQIDEMLDDMERRYREFGSTMRAVWEARRGVAESAGRKDLARQAHVAFLQTERDELSDCEACEQSSLVGYLSGEERWTEAVDVAESILRRRLKCSHEPHTILGLSLEPLFRLGRLDEARKNHERGYRLVRRGAEFVQAWSWHLEFLVLMGEMEASRRLFERHLNDALNCEELPSRFNFLTSGLLFTERLLRNGTTTVKFRLPKSVDISVTRKGCEVTALAEWMRRAAHEIADRFDARNGNTSYSDDIDDIDATLHGALPIVESSR